MTEPITMKSNSGSLTVFDDGGRLIGTIERPVAGEPFGPGREKVFLARRDEPAQRTAA